MPTSTRVLAFDEALQRDDAHSGSRSVLLGNGFSRAFSDDFNYRRLWDVAPMTTLAVDKDDLFDEVESDDFEVVINTLRRTASLVSLYEPHRKVLRDRLRSDAMVVKRGLTDAISEIHPESAWSVPDDEYQRARRFLINFSDIYTLNYDLLLYWTVLQELPPRRVVKRDGFNRQGGGPLLWRRPNSPSMQRIFYLHGAFHLFVHDRRVHKLSRSGQVNLIDQLRGEITSGHYPLVVTEGSTDDKLARIARSAYLTYCHERFSEAEGSLFVHGMALSQNDEHILAHLTSRACQIDALYVSVHGPPSSSHRNTVMRRARELVDLRRENGGRRLSLHFYRSASVRVWR